MQRHVRFTALRKHVLELICSNPAPIGAYTLLDRLRSEGRNAAPPTIYRSLDFLLEQGFVHKLTTNNTYLACAHPQTQHAGLFLVCEKCGLTQEIHTSNVDTTVKKSAERYDFLVGQAKVEVIGLCGICKN